MSMTVLYRDQSWWLGKDENNYYYWLQHECDVERHVTIRRGLNASFDQFKRAESPCSFCKSICPEPLQGLYNMLVYL